MARDVAAQVLSEVDAGAVWKKLILQHDKPEVVANVMEYLTDRLYGRPAQAVQGNPEQPVQLQWSSTPEWLPSIIVNQPRKMRFVPDCAVPGIRWKLWIRYMH